MRGLFGLCLHLVHRGRWHSSHTHFPGLRLLRVSKENALRGNVFSHLLQVCDSQLYLRRLEESHNKQTALWNVVEQQAFQMFRVILAQFPLQRATSAYRIAPSHQFAPSPRCLWACA